MSTEFTPNIPFPAAKKAATSEKPVDAPLSLGQFHADARALVDARREHLARLGMDPRHVEALRMPATERVSAPPVHQDALPEPAQGDGLAVRTLPRLAGVDFGIDGESDEGPHVIESGARRGRGRHAAAGDEK